MTLMAALLPSSFSCLKCLTSSISSPEMHIHDEVVVSAPLDMPVSEICYEMGNTPDWIEGLYLRADGYDCQFYQKD